MAEKIEAKGSKRVFSEIEIMAKIERLLPGLSKAGLEFISAKIQEVYTAKNGDDSDKE